MNKIILFFCIVFLVSCNNTAIKNTAPENNLDAGRQFIEYVLKGNFTSAKELILLNQSNKTVFDGIVNKYQGLTSDQKKQLNEASIVINSIEEIDGLTTIITYYTSVDKQVKKIKIISNNQQHLIDLAYTFNGNL